MAKNIKILLVDDHQVVRDGLQRMLEQEDDLQVVGQSSNSDEALARIDELSPDIVLMDIKMPGMDGIELARLAKKRHPMCNIIMLTLYEQYLTQALEAGARGYLLKDIKRRELAQAIRQVHNGQVVTSESIKSKFQFSPEEIYRRRLSEGLAAPVEERPAMRPSLAEPYQMVRPVDFKEVRRPEPAQAIKQVHHEHVVTSEGVKSTIKVDYQEAQQAEEVSLLPVEEIQVVLPPPVEATQLMKLAGRIEEVLHSRVLQMVGAWQEGTVMTIVLTQAAPLPDILNAFSSMPEIGAVGDKPVTESINTALISKAEAIPRLKNRNRKTIFVTLDKS